MSIRAVVYYEAWCDDPADPHRIELGDHVAYSERDLVEDEVREGDGIVYEKTGAVYCGNHRPPSLCPVSDTGEHLWDDTHEHVWDDALVPADVACVECGAERREGTPGAD